MSPNPTPRLKPLHPRLGKLSYRLTKPLIKWGAKWWHMHQLDSPYSRERLVAMQQKLQQGEPVYLLGLGAGGHNTGVALVEATAQAGVRLICNNEEERFTGIKHYADYPALSVTELLRQMAALKLQPDDIHACLTNWDYIELLAHSVRTFAEEFPYNLALLKPQPRTTFITDYRAVLEAFSAPGRLAQQLGLASSIPLINLRHHDNHAYFSYAVSPFAHSPQPVMVAIIDGSGDDGSISLYVAQNGQLSLIYNNNSMFDSLGTFYSFISTTQGGWSPLSSEGRYMGAAAWGDGHRLTNAYYRQLRQIFHLGQSGRVYLNRALANWPRAGFSRPYTPALARILGEPILPTDFWNPDKILKVDEVSTQHPPATQQHLDKAAATQMIFEDGLVHIIDHFIRQTGSHQLVLSGGTALNCVANMRLLELFDETYYAKHLPQTSSRLPQSQTRLQLWVPPIPGDAGTPAGAAFHFALRGGASPGPPLPHAFYCGHAPTTLDLQQALHQAPDLTYTYWGNISNSTQKEEIADRLARLVAQNEIVGLFQGIAETGPRALGHRSILANPCQADARQRLNERVKYREIIRPLAPMLTLAAAQRWFELSPGAATANYNAYNYMVLTAQAKPEAHQRIPAVIHYDGTSRLQIVRPEIDPLTYSYLKALGRHLGVEVSVNTSLNVGSPIAQTPLQAIKVLRRATGLYGLLLVGADGQAFFVKREA